MSCDTYKDTLFEACAGGEELGPEVRQHLEDCTDCHTTLEREQELHAAIDSGLHARLSESPSPSFLANVRMQISYERPPSGWWNHRWAWAWAWAGAAVAILLFVLAKPLVHRQREGLQGSMPQTAVASIPQRPAMASGDIPGDPGTHGRTAKHATKARVVLEPTNRAPEVLVPPDEREALARFVSHLRQGDEVARAFVQPQPQEPGELFEIRPVEIARLQVKPLAWESWR
jgi:hypothetical protein